jgi:hypothetical protein
VDKHIGVPGNNEQMKQRFRRITYPLQIFTHVQDSVDFICTQEETKTSVFLIVSGTLGKEIIPLIYGFSCIVKIYIYCRKIEAHVDWAYDYIDKILMFNFDEELLIRLTNEIAKYLMNVAEEEKAGGHNERATGLLDWADWLYHDAITYQEPYSQKLRDLTRQLRQKININHHIQYPNRFSA